jgi:hypothetical protein
MSLPENPAVARSGGNGIHSVLGRDERSINSSVGGRIGRRDGVPSADKRHLLALKAGDSFGDASVLGDERWASAWGIDADFQAMEDSHISYLFTWQIIELLEKEPRFAHIRKRFLAMTRSVASNERFTEKKARTVFRWSLITQLVMRARANDFADFASSISRANHGLGGSGSPLAQGRSSRWSLTRRHRSSSITTKSPSRQPSQQIVSPGELLTDPLANGKRGSQMGINVDRVSSISGTPVAHAELGMLDLGSGAAFKGLGSPTDSQ